MSLALNTDGPTSTTKALLVSVIAPRLYSVKKNSDIEGIGDAQAEDVAPRIYDAPAALVDTNLLVDSVDKNESKNQDEKDSIVPEGAHTAELFIQSLSNKKVLVPDDVVVVEDANSDEINRDDTRNEEKEEEISPEEEAAVKKKSDDPDDAEIDIEELLRITFQSLLEEWHFLNFPVYTTIHRRIEDVKTPEALSFHRQSSDTSNATRAWIQVQVMARPPSLGAILDRLERIGVGTDTGTVSVFRAELCRTASPYAHLPIPAEEEKSSTSGTVTPAVSTSTLEKVVENDTETDDPSKEEQERLMNERMIQEARQEWKNAATKLRIEQVREQIEEQSALSFDFLALLAVASILAGIGLITENTVVIVASMLVSPIMGPVLGCTFGSRIQDWILVKASLLNEVLALIGCVLIGVLVGLASSFTNLTEDWPTNEMQIRGEPSGLLTGIAIAIPSGMGVCLSILGGNTSSLVGVAISASLLPPAVNTGVCFVYSFFLGVGAVTNANDKNAHDFAVIGGISLALTIINILCIWVSGIIMFEIKEVTPAKQKSAFWAKDLKTVRKWNKSSEGGEGHLPPVKVEVLKKGVKSALNKSQSEIHVDTVRFQAPSPRKKPPPRSWEETMALKERKANEAGLLGPLWAGSSMSVGPPKEDPHVRYVGLEDMGTLLGFDDDEDDEEEDEDEVNATRGWGMFSFGE